MTYFFLLQTMRRRPIIPAIKKAVANGKPSIINVEVDRVSLSPAIAGYAHSVKGD